MFRRLQILACLPLAFAQRPSTIPICDYYSTSILGSNTASSQSLLITLLINTVVLGNYTTPNTGISVHGIASPIVYNGEYVNLLSYFDGSLNSTNTGGAAGVYKPLLDDGAATALGKNMSSNGDTGSVQFNLLTHIYQYFGTMLGCSKQGVPEFPAYLGKTSMYKVHQYMDLDLNEMNFFIDQCADSAASLGFAPSDVSIFRKQLQAFNTRCAAPIALHGISAPAELQSVCIADDCPLDPSSDCGAYPNNGVALIPMNATTPANTTSNTTTSATSTAVTATGSAAPSVVASLGIFSAQRYTGAWMAAVGFTAMAFVGIACV